MLRPGDSVPDFTVTTSGDRRVDYRPLWQRKNLLLVSLPGDVTADAYVAHLTGAMGELSAHDTECVITTDRIPGVPTPGVVIADRWGEIHFVMAGTVGELPDVRELVASLRFVQQQCPECDAEAK